MKIQANLLALTLVAAVTGSGLAQAHEGHPHKVLGTVSAFHADTKTLDVKANADGKVVTVAIGSATKLIKGTGAAAAAASTADLKEGLRVVVNFKEEGTAKTATQIRISAAPKPATAPGAATAPASPAAPAAKAPAPKPTPSPND